MLNFNYSNPTRIIFGDNVEADIGSVIRQEIPSAKRVMVIYGGGSAVKSGLLDVVTQSLESAGLSVVVKGGVQPNPVMEFVYEAMDECRHSPVDAIVAVGGGSVIDTAKTTAAGLLYDGDVWDCFIGKGKVTQAYPVFAVLTIPAAGSEQSIRAVMTKGEIKTGIGVECIRPRACFINPKRFFTLPKKQIRAGVIDMFSHICERYFSRTTATQYVDAQAEAALRTILEFGPKVYAQPDDYDSWCQIALAGTVAHNGYFGWGREEDWACHAIEHALSGWRESITHGEGLAVVMPAWMRYVATFEPRRLVSFAREVFGITQAGSDEEIIALGLAKFTSWIQMMELPLTLEAVDAADAPIDVLAQRCCANGPIGKYKPLEVADVEAILLGAKAS